MVKQLGNLSIVIFATLVAACSTVKDVTNVDLWPFGNGGEQGREYLPANSTPYGCEGNKKFYVRYLDKGASVWLILPDREVALAEVGTSKVYSNGITKLDLSTDVVTLEVNETTKYLGCKANPIASVSKVEPKPALLEPVAKAEEKAKPSEPVAVVKEEAPANTKTPEPVAEVATAEAPAPVVATEIAPSVDEQKAEVAEEKTAVQDDAQAAVAKAVAAWAEAWRTKNANAYLNFYSASFKPDGMSKKAWVAQRKQRVGANPSDIRLDLNKLDIAVDAKRATATFMQHYASGKYSDDVVKELNFENINGQWLIVKETAKALK